MASRGAPPCIDHGENTPLGQQRGLLGGLNTTLTDDTVNFSAMLLVAS